MNTTLEVSQRKSLVPGETSRGFKIPRRSQCADGGFEPPSAVLASLESLALDVSELNFNLRYPEGLADLAAERAQQGYSMSRRWAAMMSGHPVADELAGPQPR